MRFADDIDLLGGNEEELEQFTERLEKSTAGYGMEINSDYSKMLVISIKPRSSTNKWKNRKTVEEVDQFKYLGSTQIKDGTSIKEVKISASTLSPDKASNRPKNRATSFPTKIKFYKSLVCLVNTAL